MQVSSKGRGGPLRPSRGADHDAEPGVPSCHGLFYVGFALLE